MIRFAHIIFVLFLLPTSASATSLAQGRDCVEAAFARVESGELTIAQAVGAYLSFRSVAVFAASRTQFSDTTDWDSDTARMLVNTTENFFNQRLLSQRGRIDPNTIVIARAYSDNTMVAVPVNYRDTSGIAGRATIWVVVSQDRCWAMDLEIDNVRLSFGVRQVFRALPIP